MKRELFAAGVVAVVLGVFPAALLGYQAARSSAGGVRTIDIVARMPEAGGFAPDAIRVNRGERVRLRLSAPDVVHGFEIPGLGVSAADIYPGHVVEVTFTADEVGRYTFACTRWCSATHWRMRGIVEVVDPANPDGSSGAPAPEPPLYQRLGLNLDAMPEMDSRASRALEELVELPSAARAEAFNITLPGELRDQNWLRTHTPAEAFVLLRTDETNRALGDGQIWDLVVYAWQTRATGETLARAARLYARDCAACHGEQGRGDGVMGRDLPGLQGMMPELKRGPADFTDIRRMAAVSDAFLQGKLLRGGMGTGMPYFGSLYSIDDQWALVALIRTFAMDRSQPDAAVSSSGGTR